MSSETTSRQRDHVRRGILAAGEKKLVTTVARTARRRRLELRRLGRTASAAAEEDAAKRVRVRPAPAESSSSDSSDSARVPPEPAAGVVARCSAYVSHGAVSVIGRRREMEDAVAVAPPFLAEKEVECDGDGGGEQRFFAVYDGHGGSRVAEACRERMHVVLAEEVRRLRRDVKGTTEDDCCATSWWKEAMAACFARVDGEVGADDDDGTDDAGEQTVGSTAVVAVVGPRRVVVANCGDSRAVLSRGGAPVPLSSDHKPDRPDEMERVEAAGGRVINWNGYRILGVLATSRSIGDYYLKPYVIAEPEVTVVDRTDKDEFLILASDGLWDVVSNDAACKIVRNCLSGRAASKYPESVSGSTASDAAALLVELAISRGSKDNISVIVVELRRLKSRTAVIKENCR